MNYLTNLLDNSHNRASFSSGKEMLDLYIHKLAKQDMKRRLAVCFVLTENGIDIQGYYTLSSSSIPKVFLPDGITKRLPPNYSDLPVTLLGRMAVDLKYQGQGIGKLLLVDAMRRSYETSVYNVASMALVVDPLDFDARCFYEKFGFIALQTSERMFLPMTTIANEFIL